MSGFQITITDAGRAALVNAQNTGTQAMVVNEVGVTNVQIAAELAGLTALPNEIKRLATFGGDVVADDTLHLTIRDESADAYHLRAFGLYFANGVLFAVYSQATPIVEKSSSALLLLATDVILTRLGTTQLTFGSTDFLNPPATTDRQGVVELATPDETLTGTDGTRSVTPFGLRATLMAWASGFAAAVHTHGMSDIVGLAMALAGKASLAHAHDAEDTTTGIFNVARIPSLGLSKIVGLIDALAGKQPVLGFSPVNAQAGQFVPVNGTVGGQFELSRPANNTALDANVVVHVSGNALRIFENDQDLRGVYIDLTQCPPGVNGLLFHSGNFNPASKSNVGHGHVVTDVVGLQAALEGKAASAHTHEIGAVTGLQAGLDGKSATGHGHAIGQVAGLQAALDGKQPTIGYVPANRAGETYTGYHSFTASSSAAWGSGGAVRITAASDPAISLKNTGFGTTANLLLSDQLRLSIGANPTTAHALFHEGNFDPSSKAPAIHSHDWAQVTGKPGWVVPDQEGTAAAIKRFPSKNTSIGNAGSFQSNLEVIGTGGAAFIAFHRPDIGGGYLGIDIDNNWRVGGWTDGPSKLLFHEGNFNPASKAEAVHGHTIGQIAGLQTALDAKQATIGYVPANRAGDTYSGHHTFTASAAGAWGSGGALRISASSDPAISLTNTGFGTKVNLVLSDVLRVSLGANPTTAHVLFHEGNFDPSAKAPAIHSHDWAQVTGKPGWVLPDQEGTATATKRFISSNTSIGDEAGGKSALEVNGSGGAAFMAFHRPGQGAGYFGLDIDNNWRVGGWTDGPSKRLFHEGNFTPALKANLESPAFTGVPSFPAETVFRKEVAGSSEGGQLNLERPDNSTLSANACIDVAGDSVRVFERGGAFRGAQLPLADCAGGVADVLATRRWVQDNVSGAGELKLYDLESPPAGVRAVVANGAEVSRATYARLFAAIGTRYGNGDGGSTFNLPDWRGLFFRGLDLGRGLDSGRSLGTYQDSQNRAHSHTLPVRSNPDAGNGWVEDAANSGGLASASTGVDGGDEARPRNTALLACVTY